MSVSARILPSAARVEFQWKHASTLVGCRFDPSGRFLFAANQRYAEVARRSGVPLTVDFRPGVLEWQFLDDEIRTVLDWLPGLTPPT